jgi:hypothetical protein
VERKGHVVAKYVGSVSTAKVEKMPSIHVLPPSMIFTDESPIYKNLNPPWLRTWPVKHSANVYVDGDVHTPGIEGYWSLVKRGSSGVTTPYRRGFSPTLANTRGGTNHRDKLRRHES